MAFFPEIFETLRDSRFVVTVFQARHPWDNFCQVYLQERGYANAVFALLCQQLAADGEPWGITLHNHDLSEEYACDGRDVEELDKRVWMQAFSYEGEFAAARAKGAVDAAVLKAAEVDFCQEVLMALRAHHAAMFQSQWVFAQVSDHEGETVYLQRSRPGLLPGVLMGRGLGH